MLCLEVWSQQCLGPQTQPSESAQGTGAEARPERSVEGQGNAGHPAGVGQAEKVAPEGPERGPLEGRAGHRP